MADVYAGDDALNAPRPETPEHRLVTFYLSTDAQPDVLPRVASQLYIFHSAPERVSLQRSSDDTSEIEIVILGASRQQIDSACRKFLQLTCVSRVEALTADSAQLFTG